MRVIFMLIVTILFITGCQSISNQKKAEKAVTEYLKKNIDDPDSYQSVSFDLLINDSSSYKKKLSFITERLNITYNLYKILNDKAEKSFGNKDVDVKQKEKDINVATKYQDSVEYYKAVYNSLNKDFVPELEGYQIEHIYRAKNLMNALMLHNEMFYLDTTFMIKTVVSKDR